MNTPILLLKVTLRHTLPRVWRRLLVPGDLSLARFHFVIQASMGWADAPAHHFEDAGGVIYSPKPFGRSRRTGYEAKLVALLHQVGTHATYHFGFEEDWEHDLTLEALIEDSSRNLHVRCTGGEGRCPPEGCGGPLGFSDLLQNQRARSLALADFNPALFKISAVNAALRRLRP